MKDNYKYKDMISHLREYSEENVVPMHMPGAKRNNRLINEYMPDIGNPYEIDITEIDGFDNMHNAEGIIKAAFDRTARLYGADESLFLVNGSTAGNMAAICGVTNKGDCIIAARNCHVSVYNAIIQNELEVEYVYPQYDEKYGYYKGITLEEIKEAVEKHLLVSENIKAVVITSPTYEGNVSDIKSIAEYLHSYNIPLIVDEAHGAHFRFSEYFPVSAAQLGADVVINSVHKTLPCLTQTGVIHLCSDRVSREKLKRFLGIYQSSSPSYILMSSIDACMDKLEREGDEMFRVFTENLEKARRRLSGCKYIRLVTPQACECQRVFDFDRSKILLSTVNSSLNGRELHQILRREFHLEMEMEAENYVLALAAVGDTAGFERLCDAIEEIDRRESLKYREEAVEKEPLKNGKMKQIMRISQAMDAESERCPLDECIGRTSGEFAYLYPPGIPLIVPGEQISGHFVKNVRRYLEQGFEVQGLSDQTSETVCVVRNEM